MSSICQSKLQPKHHFYTPVKLGKKVLKLNFVCACEKPYKNANKDFEPGGFGFLQRKYDWILWSRR